jgi:hypothetical protein
MGGRKNDGVTMTNQLATSNTHSLGMTTDNEMLNRYIDTPNPGKPSFDPRLDGAHTPRAVLLKSEGGVRIKLVHYENAYYFLREDARAGSGQRSITYGNEQRALQVFRAGAIRWWRETYSPFSTPTMD